MGKYGSENWERFQREGVQPEDIKAMKVEDVRDAFADTKADFEHLIEKLSAGIKDGRWTAILGDDVSGRLPANVLGEVASRYAQEHGQKPPARLFFAGGGLLDISPDAKSREGKDWQTLAEERQEKLEQYIKDQSQRLGNRVLIVNEHIMSGRTTKRICEALEKQGIEYDVAALWAGDEMPKLGEHSYVGKEYAGASGPFGSEVWNVLYKLGVPSNEATGVKKDGIEPITKRNDSANRDLVQVAREEVSKLADELYSKYFSTDTSPER